MSVVRIVVYPQYELTVNGKVSFVSMQHAARAMDSLMNHVKVGDCVRESDGAMRVITEDEKNELNRLTDEWSSMR